jgi:hypothetical protein
MSNRRQRKLEKKRKKRTLAKKKARVAAAQRPKPDQLLVQAAARSPFGPCSVSADWDNEEAAQLVTVIVTRRLPDDRLVPGIALVDRTCLGIKDGYFLDPMSDVELGELVEELGTPHGGMVTCEPLVAQSVVYHAIDYAQRLGFAPGPDFRADGDAVARGRAAALRGGATRQREGDHGASRGGGGGGWL